MPTAPKRIKNSPEFIRKVAERVWQLWQEDLRHERERRGRQKQVKR